MTKIYKYYIYILLISPLIGYISYHYMGGILAWQVLSGAVLFIAFIYVTSPIQRKVIPKFLWPYLFYILYINIWNLYNGIIDDKGILKYLATNYHVYTALIIIIIYNFNYKMPANQKIISLIKIVMIVAFSGALLQLLIDPMLFIRPTGWDSDTLNIYLSRRPSVFTYVSDNDYGITVLALFSVLLSFMHLRKNTRSTAIYITIVGLYSILTNTRYIMLGFLLVVTQLFINSKVSLKVKYVYIIIFTFFIGYYIYTNILGFNINLLLQERILTEKGLQYSGRFFSYLLFVEFFQQAPIFGIGVDTSDEILTAAKAFGTYHRIHIGYLSHLVSYGIVGSVLLFSFWFLLASDLYRKAKLTGYYGSFFAFLVFLWLNVTSVSYNLFYPGIIISLIYSQYYFNKYAYERQLKRKGSEISFYNYHNPHQ